MVNKELLKGSTPMLVLSVLAGGPSYGYEIAKRIEERSEGTLKGKEGTIYPILHQLEMKNWLTSYKETVEGRTRKYYRLTPKGKAVLAKLFTEWKAFSEAVDKTVGPIKSTAMELASGWAH
jgi:PadR family transcriptional regulator PadR